MSTRQTSDHATQIAKVFWNGRSQAVRLPQDYRFKGNEVAIRREGDKVVLEPLLRQNWPEGYWKRLKSLSRQLDLEPITPLAPGKKRPSL